MFFDREITTVFITRDEIRSAVFSPKGKIKKAVKTFSWNEETLAGVLGEIAARGPARTRVVFGEEFSYVTSVLIQGKKRAGIFRQAQEKIPECLKNNWDFKKERSSEVELQIAAITSKVLDLFEAGFAQAGLDVESIEPQSIAIGRLLPEKGLYLFITDDKKILLGYINDGTVELAYVTAEDRYLSELEDFIIYVRKKAGREPEIVFIGRGIDPNYEIFQKNNILTKAIDLDPLRGTALKENITGADYKVLNIENKKADLVESKVAAKPSQVSATGKVLVVILIFLIILATAIIFWRKF